MDAVYRLVERRGGMSKLGDLAQRAIHWNEFYVRAPILQEPRYPYVPLKRATALPSALREEAAELASHTRAKLPVCDAPVLRLLDGLHQLSLTAEMKWKSRVVSSAIGNVMYPLEYDLQVLMAEQANDTSDQEELSDSTLILNALAIASQIFLWVALRHGWVRCGLLELFARSPLHDIYLLMLMRALEKREAGMVWMRERYPNALVWMLFVGAASGFPDGPERVWFVERLRVMIGLTHLGRAEDFEEILRLFPWTDDFCKTACANIWLEATTSATPRGDGDSENTSPALSWRSRYGEDSSSWVKYFLCSRCFGIGNPGIVEV
ncbi:hypothetical protein B0A49_11987 [Cryomyces minteri]|uniref:Uncharacterized protein n=1 Tax=Cryomyces minteri TaxID=331657 RepID=A0A4U0WCN0_9PEZI|nr:hypothetical protein B0A49_11987 [Cryomyces minteri]